ncbi:hypothetical protein [Sinorhizobium meliloti]|uniref:hypothetical protein n=1 Tax=Rhizobium meliloti TaxID=382 RepID=UPI00299D2523|nr:hypothetical protein [Sinorhizobium meliloti]
MGKRSSFPRRKADDYATPLKGVMPVIPHLRAEGIVTFVEPCAGAGNLVAHLCRFGFLCAFARDLRDGFDALTCDPNIFQGADAIVTNPPWTRTVLHPMIERFSDILPTWLLFDADWAHTKQAAPYIDYCSTIVSVGRLKWVPGTKHSGKDSASWYRFDRRHSGGPRFIGQPRFRQITLAEIAEEEEAAC